MSAPAGVQIVCVVVLLAASVPAQPLIWFPAQRETSVYSDFQVLGEPPPIAAMHSGPAAGVWNDLVYVTNESQNPFARLHVSAGQHSEPTGEGLTCHQLAAFEYVVSETFVEAGAASHSVFVAFVAISGSTDVTATGLLSASCDAEYWPTGSGEFRAAARFELRRVGGEATWRQEVVTDLVISDPNHTDLSRSEPIQWGETIAPGVYEILVETSVTEIVPLAFSLSWEPSRVEASLVLELRAAETPPSGPCAGDLDGDDDTDMLDFALFQSCFDGPRP